MNWRWVGKTDHDNENRLQIQQDQTRMGSGIQGSLQPMAEGAQQTCSMGRQKQCGKTDVRV